MEHPHRKQVIDRLARIEGHIRGVKRMAEEDKPCEAILIQLSAVRAALNQAARLVLEDHLEVCVREGIKSGNGEQVLCDLKAALGKII
jgi:CsoR family transcriptional regulator, copper-sensing transcriptional repressor